MDDAELVSEYQVVRLNSEKVKFKTPRNRVPRDTGLPKRTSFHTLSHTFASWHIRAGTDIRELMELGGWSSFNSMKRYTHLSNEHRKSAASRIEGMVLR